MERVNAMLTGGMKEYEGRVIRNVGHPKIWTPFEEYVKTDKVDDNGYVIYEFNKKR